MMQCLPDGLRLLITDRGAPPSVPSAEDLPMLHASREMLLQMQKGDDRKEIAILVNRLLLHYPLKQMTPEMNRMVAEDWLEDLGEFPSWAVARACKKYRRENSFRPTVDKILANCKAEIAPLKHKEFRIGLMIKDAEMTARINSEMDEKIQSMKADGSWETMKADFYGRIKNT